MNKKEKTPNEDLQNPSESIRIRNIKVTKLFNMFEYDCDFDENNDISILIARNGCGKTTILNMIDFIFNPTQERFNKICNIPFGKFCCELSNKKKLELIKRYTEDQSFVYKIGNAKKDINKRSIIQLENIIFNTKAISYRSARNRMRFNDYINYTRHYGDDVFFNEALFSARRRGDDENYYEALLSEIDRIKNEKDIKGLRRLQRPPFYHILPTGFYESLNKNLDDIINNDDFSEKHKFSIFFSVLIDLLERLLKEETRNNEDEDQFEKLRNKLKNVLGQDFSEAFKNATNGLSVNYIPANRLFIESKKNEESEESEEGEEDKNTDIVTLLNDDIKNRFAEKDKNYKDKLQKAKDIIPKRFLTERDIRTTSFIEQTSFGKAIKFFDTLDQSAKKNNTLNEVDALEALWDQYFTEVENLQTYDLIDSNLDKSLYNTAKEQSKVRFLMVYIEEYQKTLEPLRPFYEQIKLFLDILNERNKTTRKTFSFSRVNGIVLKVGRKELPLDCMSSGEKNDFAMFYDLIFKSKKGGLILMDEPEISLHIEWQETILSSMFEICKMNNLQAIIATHSPHILNGHEELVLNGGPFYEG